jgi:hypothetical protein
LVDTTGRTILLGGGVEDLQVADINAVIHWHYLRPRKRLRLPSRNAPLLASSFQSLVQPELLRLVSSVLIALLETTRMVRAKAQETTLLKGRACVVVVEVVMVEVRAWP